MWMKLKWPIDLPVANRLRSLSWWSVASMRRGCGWASTSLHIALFSFAHSIIIAKPSTSICFRVWLIKLLLCRPIFRRYRCPTAMPLYVTFQSLFDSMNPWLSLNGCKLTWLYVSLGQYRGKWEELMDSSVCIKPQFTLTPSSSTKPLFDRSPRVFSRELLAELLVAKNRTII